MNPKEYMARILEELGAAQARLDARELDEFAAAVGAAGRVFTTGAGRSGLAMKGFAMRLMQTGHTAYAAGEVVTPAILQGDLLVLGSGSGETKGLVLSAQTAKQQGAKIALLTARPASTLGGMADMVMHIPTGTNKHGDGGSFQPGGSAFEQSLMLALDAVVLRLMEDKPGVDVMTLHANLE